MGEPLLPDMRSLASSISQALYRNPLPRAAVGSHYGPESDESDYPFTSSHLDRRTTNAALIQHLLNTAITFSKEGVSKLSYLQVVNGIGG